MTKYEKPVHPNKYELSARIMLQNVERAIRSWLVQSGDAPGRSIRQDPELYYDNDRQPCCFLEMHLGPASSFRVGVQRNSSKKKRAKWTIGWNVYDKGRSIDAGEFDATGISQIKPELTKKILGNYSYLIS